MLLSEFSDRYCLHDGILESVEWNKAQKIATITMELCAFMQLDYQDDISENEHIRLVFNNVKYIKHNEYDPRKVYDAEMLSCECPNEGQLVICALDDGTQLTGGGHDYFTIEIVAESVDVQPVT